MSQDQDSFINSLRELNSKCEDPTVNQYVRASISILCCLIVVMLLANLRILILRAQRGDMEAANEMLLPGYWWLVIGFAFTCLLDAAYLLVWDLNGVGVVCRDGDSIDCSTLAILAGLELACRRFVIDGVAVFFMHYGAGQRALRSTVCIVAPWALFVGFVEFLWNQRPNDDDAGNHYENNPASSNFWTAHNTAPNFNALSLGLEITYASLMVIFYGSLAFFPPHVVYRRPALGNWYIGWQLVTMILINVDVVVVSAMHYSYGSCVYYISFTFLEVLVGPFILWGTLKDDSKYWQGLLFVDDDTNVSSSHWSNFAGCVDSLFRCARNGTSQSTGTNSSNTSPLLDAPSSPEDHYRRTSSTYPSTANNTSQTSAPQHVTLTQPLLGQSLMTDAAQELASTMELLSETPNVEFLHFGLLSIETILAYDHPSAFVLGAGGAAKVYKGRLRGEPVAIKMIWSVDITAEIVAQFREEVIMLAKLARHPSVVQLKGYSVMPPALCVVMELCSKGSLLELLEGIRNDAASAEEATRFRRKATLLRQEYERQPLNSPRKSDGSYSDINAVSGMQQLVGGNETVANHGSFGAGNAENVGTMSRPRYSSAGSNSSDVSTVLVALEQTWPARLQMACECAEAVAFLHLQKPPVMHKDIKSSNFLVVENSAPPGGWNSSWVYKSAPAAALSVSARSLSSLFSSNGSNSRSGASENQGVQKKWRYEIRLSDLGSAVESLVELAQSDANSTRSDSHVGDVNSPLVGGLNAPRVSLNGAGLEPEKRERFGSGSNGGSLITGPRRHGRRPPIPRRGSGSGWGSSADGSERARSSCTGERQSMEFSGHEGPRQHYSFGASPRTATSTAAGAALVGGGNIRYSESSVGSATRGTMNGLAGWVPGATGTVTPPRRRHSDVSRESLGGLEYDENKVYELQVTLFGKLNQCVNFATLKYSFLGELTFS